MTTQYLSPTNRLLATAGTTAVRTTKHYTLVVYISIFALILLVTLILAAMWYYIEEYATESQDRSRDMFVAGLESESDSNEAKVAHTTINDTGIIQENNWSTQFVQTRKRRGNDSDTPPVPQTLLFTEKEPNNETGSDHGPVDFTSDGPHDSTSPPSYQTFAASRNGSSTTEDY